MDIGFRNTLNRFIFFTPRYLAFDIVRDNPFLISNDETLQKSIILLTIEKQITNVNVIIQFFSMET